LTSYGKDRLVRHARQALFLALVAVLVTVTGAKALDADSPEYALRDAAGNNFRLIARVRHTRTATTFSSSRSVCGSTS
jgi:hypothetical protein